MIKYVLVALAVIIMPGGMVIPLVFAFKAIWTHRSKKEGTDYEQA